MCYNKILLTLINTIRQRLQATKELNHSISRIIKESTFTSTDDRIELYELRNLFLEGIHRSYSEEIAALRISELYEYLSQIEQNANRVVMVVHKKYIKDNGNSVIIKATSLKNKIESSGFQCCDGTAYADQLSAYLLGSGFFISGDIIATAAHLFVRFNLNIQDFRFIRGVIKKNKETFQEQFIASKSDVWESEKKYIPHNNHRYIQDGSDWAIIKVKPSYIDYNPLALNNLSVVRETTSDLTKDRKVYAIGHGLGLSMKVSLDGDITQVKEEKNYYECTLTLLNGNSGSPVFFADTHELAGIYMRGQNHLTPKGDCLVIENKNNFPEGQECQMLAPVHKAIKQIDSLTT